MIEKVVTFGPGHALTGVLTRAGDAPEPGGRPMVVMLNSGVIHHVGIWRLHVRLARALAECGLDSLRFDLSGIGDSEAPGGASSLEELIARDIEQALDFAQGTLRSGDLFLFGLCSGAWDALGAASRDPRVAAVVAVDLIAEMRTWQYQCVHAARRLANPAWWLGTVRGQRRLWSRIANGVRPRPNRQERERPTIGIRPGLARSELVERLTALLARNVGLHFIYSAGLERNYNHRSQFSEAFPTVARDFRLSLHYMPRADHTFSDREEQNRLIALIMAQLVEEKGRHTNVPTATESAPRSHS